MANEITIFNKNDQKSNEKTLEVCLREEEVQDKSRSAQELFLNLQNELNELDDLKDGLSYLDMKNDTLLSYMIDLCNIVLRKVKGDTILGHASVERSVYYRVILEKIKAIDQRLAYQLNKVITLPDEATEENQGVNVNNLDIDIASGDEEEDADDDEDDDEDSEFDGSVDDDEEEDHDEDDEKIEESLDDTDEEDEKSNKKDTKLSKAKGSGDKKAVGIYKPPKLRSVAYGKERRDHNDIYQDDDGGDIVDKSHVQLDRERVRWEEENYTRLPAVKTNKRNKQNKTNKPNNKAKRRRRS